VLKLFAFPNSSTIYEILLKVKWCTQHRTNAIVMYIIMYKVNYVFVT